MGFRQANKDGIGGYARVFKAEDKGKYSVVNLCCSKKNKETGEYDTDFQSGIVRFIGAAHEKISGMDIGPKGVPIQIISCDVTVQVYNEKYYTNYIVYDFDVQESNSSGSKSSGSKSGTSKKTKKKTAKPEKKEEPSEEEEDEDSELPF